MSTRKPDAAWTHGTEVVVEGKRKKVKCNYCSKVVGGITRFKQHLARVGKDVTGCLDVPSQVYEEMRNNLVQYHQKVGQISTNRGQSSVQQTNVEIEEGGHQALALPQIEIAFKVDGHISYQESLSKFAKDLGPTAQSIASKKLKQLSLAHAFQAPVPHRASSAWRLSDDPKGKSVIMDRGSERNSVSAIDTRSMGHFDRVGTLSAGSAYIASFADASRIQISTDVVPRSVRENVYYPTHNHNQLVLHQHHWPTRNSAVINAYTVRPGYHVPIAYEERPAQIAYPSTTIRPLRLSAMCHASGSGCGVHGGHQSTPPNELERHANPAALGQGFQHTLNNSHTHLQNQPRLEPHEQHQMGLEQQTLPLLSSMFDAGTSSAVQNHQTTSNAPRNGQQLPLAHRPYINLELQLRTKSPSPDEASPRY